MYKKFLLTLLFISSFNIFSQECGTSRSKTSARNNYNCNYSNPLNNKNYCLKVQWHIFTKDDGTGGITEVQIRDLMSKVNNKFNPHGINFTIKGIDYIKNSNLYSNYPYNPANNIYPQPNYVKDAMNFYIVDGINPSNIQGFVPYYVTYVNFLVSNAKGSFSTLYHEIGHALGLYHTFECRYPTLQSCAENINGLNCATLGDEVCDTPADANGANANGFSPDLKNLMSYYGTRERFTTGQGLRMRNSIDCNIVNSENIDDRGILSYKCSEIKGTSEICLNTNTTYSYNLDFGSIVLMQTSSNLQIVSSTGASGPTTTSIVIKGIANGLGFLKLTFANGEVLTKNIWVGTPIPVFSYNSGGLTCPSDMNGCVLTSKNLVDIFEFDLTSSKGINTSTQYEWQNVSTNFRFNGSSTTTATGETSYLKLLSGNSISLQARAKNTCGWSDWRQFTFRFPVNNNSDLKQIGSNKNIFKIYPNPSSDVVNVELQDENNMPQQNSIITGGIYDINNRRKSEVRIKDNKAIVNVKNLEKGIYVLKINIDGVIESHQIVVE